MRREKGLGRVCVEIDRGIRSGFHWQRALFILSGGDLQECEAGSGELFCAPIQSAFHMSLHFKNSARRGACRLALRTHSSLDRYSHPPAARNAASEMASPSSSRSAT